MKLLIVIAIVVCAVDVHAAVQSLPFTDHFTYSDGNLGTVAAGVWDLGGGAGPEITVASGAGLTSPSGFATSSGKGVSWTPGGTARRNLMQFTAVSNNTVYVSFLLNVQSISSSKLIAYLENTTSSSSSPQLGIFINTGTIGIGKKASAATATTSLSAGTHLIVVRYTFQGGNDQADLWVDPSSANYGALSAPASDGSATGSSDPTAIQYFAINATSGSGPLAYIDEVRIGTSWADVTPSGTPPPPPVVLTVTQASLIPEGIELRGVGGNSSGLYEVVSSADLSNWVSLATNQFDGFGNFGCTNPASETQQFYRVHPISIIDTNGIATNVVPVAGATNVCVDTPLQITFDGAPTLGSSGLIQIYNAASPGSPVDTINLSSSSQTKVIGGVSHKYFPVIISGNSAFISLHASLAYGQTYFVNIDSNAFQGVSSWSGVTGSNAWRFTTKPSAPLAGMTNLVVAADGSGDFCAVQGAIDFVPSGNTTPRTINIQNGVYREIVYNNNRNNLTFAGQSRSQTVIMYANNENMNSGSALRSMFYTLGNDISMINLKLTNSTPQGGSQAEALKVTGQRFTCRNADLCSLQDTILISNDGDQAYFTNCLVQGNVDYVWGSGTVYFNDCEIRSMARGSSPNGYICQPRNDAAHNGIAFVDCVLTGSSNTFTNQYLARNNKNESNPASQTVFINCMMSSNIIAVGWLLDGSSDPSGLRFWEYQSTDLTGTNLLDVSQRPSWSRQLTAPEAADVRDLATWFSGWVP